MQKITKASIPGVNNIIFNWALAQNDKNLMLLIISILLRSILAIIYNISRIFCILQIKNGYIQVKEADSVFK